MLFLGFQSHLVGVCLVANGFHPCRNLFLASFPSSLQFFSVVLAILFSKSAFILFQSALLVHHFIFLCFSVGLPSLHHFEQLFHINHRQPG
jgi:hypothetical protein